MVIRCLEFQEIIYLSQSVTWEKQGDLSKLERYPVGSFNGKNNYDISHILLQNYLIISAESACSRANGFSLPTQNVYRQDIKSKPM